MEKTIFIKLSAIMLIMAMLFSTVPLTVWAQTADIITDEVQDEVVLPDDDDAEDDTTDIYANTVYVSDSSQLTAALKQKFGAICIEADFVLDQTFYVVSNTVIFSTQPRTLTRDPGFGGDIFVVGEYEDGTMCEEPVTLTLGHTESSDKDLLTIDGNRDNMTVDVTGSVIFVVCNSQADLYENVTIKNNKKVGNNKTLNEAYGVSYPNYIGGAVAIITAKASMNIYGGTYSNNAINDITDTSTEEGQISTQGGAIYSFGLLNVYDGTFENNYAGRGGVFYIYRVANIYKADIKNNTASSLGGAIYMPNSTGARLYIGGESPYGESRVYFTNNTASSYGGAIYARNILDVQNTYFVENQSLSSSGGAIAAFSMVLTISNSFFEENTAKSNGAAIYYTEENGKDSLELTVVSTAFKSNQAASSGGAIYMSSNASAYMENVNFTLNTASKSGAAIYLKNGHIDIDGGTFSQNSCSTNGGAIAALEESSIKLNEITTSGNKASKGGFAYCEKSTLHIYNSKLEENTATGDGGALYLFTEASGGVYATAFNKNVANGNGGAIFAYTDGYTAKTSLELHSCTYTYNTANCGGSIYASSRSVIDLFNSTAKYNTAEKGGFLYHTTTNTKINLASLILEGNTATTGGPIIWGNSTGAILNLDKSLYIDKEYVGTLDDAYWATAIYNKLKVNHVVIEIPNYIGYNGAEVVPELPVNPTNIANADELENALAEGKTLLRITADFQIDRTFYIYRKTTIYSVNAHTLTRAPGFSGDIFVVGEHSDGTLCENSVILTLGDPESTQQNLLTIDGNRDNMTVDVTGSVIFVVCNSQVDIYENVTIKNNKKVGNEKTLTEAYGVSYVSRIGGAVAIITSKASMNIYGGKFLNNAVNDIIDSSTEEGQISTQGGVIYNFGYLNVYGGTFENNYAARGGVFYCYRTTNIYKADIKNNYASDLGGVVYMPNSTSAILNIGTHNDVVKSNVTFTGNSAVEHGGVIYGNNKISIQNATFTNNNATSGGVIIAYNAILNISDSTFNENTASKNGGVLYISGHNSREVETDLNIVGCTFNSNTSANNGGVLYLHNGAVALIQIVTFNDNSGANGGAIYSTGSYLTMESCTLTENSADSNGGGIALYSSSTAMLNKLTANSNSAKVGGFIYSNTATMNLYRSNIENNSSISNGGGMALYAGSTSNIYATEFKNNHSGSSGNGGALFLYTNTAEVLVHSCTFTENSGNYGGAIYASNKTIAKFYNTTATNNSAVKGGFFYETTTGTTITMVGINLSGNTATDGGNIIWGNSTGAILYLDKTKYTDSDYTGTLDSAYWNTAIVNSLKVRECNEEIPKWLDYQEETYDNMADAVDVSTATQLENAINSGAPYIRIIVDIEVDRTFYITGNTTIFSTLPRKLTRAPGFGGDMFVVGQNAEGKSALLLGGNAKLTLGNPQSTKENLLIIDGNKDNMTVPVNGSILFICYSSQVYLHTNVTAINSHKTDNERTYNEAYKLPRPNRIGGALAVVASGSLNIYGGIYKDNLINEEDSSSEETRNCTIGGLIYNYSNVYIHGGTFENNQAARGGIIYNYSILNISGGNFIGNVATVSGGVIYSPNTATSHTYIGSSKSDAATVLFQNNSSTSNGGAICSSALCALVIYGNTTFDANTSDSNGGAISSYGQLTARDTIFTNNTAKSKGGAVYTANSSETYITRYNEFTNCTFKNNQATLGGAVSIYSTNAEFANGGIATITDCTFTSNIAASMTSTSAASYGGAIYVERKSSLTIDNSTFKQNTARSEGGAIYAGGTSTVKISDSDFTKNLIEDNGKHGGAISIHSVNLDVTSTKFTSNVAQAQAGALYISYSSSYDQNSSVSLKDSTFTGNSTGGLGGAIYVTKQTVTEEKRILNASNTEFSKNSASQGGAIYFVSGTTAYMTDITFTKNSALEGYGGAIEISGGIVEIDTATFTDNTSVGSGAGIALISQAELTLNAITATNNATEASGGFIYGENCTLNMYNSQIKTNSAENNAGGIALYAGAAGNIYNCEFIGNTAGGNGGGIFLYTNLTPCILHSCTFTGNEGAYGGAIYASNKAIANIYNVVARNNASNKGGFLYHTTTNTEITLVDVTVANNTATNGGPIIWGNSAGATLNLDKSRFTDENHTGTMDSDYWAAAIYNKLTVNYISATVPACPKYESKRTVDDSTSTNKKPVSVNDVFNLAKNSSDEDINTVYAKLPKLDNSSNLMSKKVTIFPNINGQDVMVDSFIYPTNGTADNCNVGAGLLIYQAMCYKKAYPEEEVYIDLSYYRFSIEAAVNINRNSRYFGYMRQLGGDANYDKYGFVRISYLLISAAKMGIHVTAIGHIDAYPLTANTMGLYEYFTSQLNDPCDPNYVSNRVIGDYLNFCQIDWTLQNKGGTDMMHTKMCAVSHYLDKDGNVHRNAVWSSSTNLDGINSKGVNANWKQQTATIITGHEAIYKTAVNYLRLITQYKEQEGIYEFQNLVNRLSTEQAQLILSGNGNLIPENEQIIYLGTENDAVFELYFTPLGGDILAWDEVQNPYCKYLRKLYNSEDYIIFTWNAAEYNGSFAFGKQIESMLIAAFHDNRNVNNKIYGRMEHFDATSFDDLEVGVDIGYKSFNEMLFGEVHNKDLQFSYVENGQRYYVTLLNSMNFHSGSMYYQSNFALVIKETDCNENSVFFTIADETTKGIVEHAYDYSEEKEYIPDTLADGYKYYSCLNCDKIHIIETIHREGNWIIDKKATTKENGVRHKNCLACGILLESQEYTVSQEESSLYLADATGRTFSATIENEQRLKLNKTPQTFEAVINVPKTFNERAGVIIGNYDETSLNKLTFEIYTLGRVRLFLVNNGERYDCLFDTDVRSDKPVHVALTVDGTLATLYVNGKQTETKELPFGLPTLTNDYIIGGDARSCNVVYFKGTLYSVNMFDDVRTAEEIERDKLVVAANEDSLLISKYYTAKSESAISYVPSGKTFTQTSQTKLGSLSKTPLTIEAVIHLPTDYGERGGVILGNYTETGTNRLNLEVHSEGKLRLYFTNNGETNDCIFNVDVRSDGPVHIAVVVDGLVATVYLNGVAKESATLTCALPSVLKDLKIGSDNRANNTQYFKGTVYSVNLFSSVRTAEEIKNDIILVSGNESNVIYSRYFAIDSAVWHDSSANAETFSNTKKHILGTLPTTPQTFEATINVPKDFDERVGVILGNYNETSLNKLTFEIYTLGRVRLFLVNNGQRYDCLFDTDIRSDKPVHIALTVNGTIATLYVNGKEKETKELPFGLPTLTNPYYIGGDARGGNVAYFKCGIYSVNLFSDVRTAEEILADVSHVSNDAENLISSTNFTSTVITNKIVDSTIIGREFTAKTPVSINNYLNASAQTFEATVYVPKDFDERAGVILGRYDETSLNKLTFEIYTYGRVRLFLVNNGQKYDCLFNTDIRSDKPVHIALSVDGTLATLYVNGEKTETKELPFGLPTITSGYKIGGDDRYCNVVYFRGTIYSVNLFSNVRSANAIKNDMASINHNDPSLLYSATFAKNVCEFFGHNESDPITDFNASLDGCGISHTVCLVCDKIVNYYKSPAISSIIESIKYENATGLVTDTEIGGFKVNTSLPSAPKTFEALIQLDKDFFTRAGVVIGNYDGSEKDQINFEIYTNGTPRLYYKVNGVAYTYNFKTDIRSDSLTHIALTIDGLNAYLYVNGKLTETVILEAELPENALDGFIIGSDNRTGNAQHFKGTIYYASMFSDARTTEEIAADLYIATSDSDGLLFAKSFMNSDEN